MPVTPYLELFLPDGSTKVSDFVAGTADAMTKLDVWAQAHASGGGGFNDGQTVDWYSAATGVGAGANTFPPTEYATVYGPDGTDLQDVSGGDLTPDALELGDDYYLNRAGADLLWFRTPGLYLAQVHGPALENAGVIVQYSSSLHGFVWSRMAPLVPGGGAGPDTPLLFTVSALEVAPEGLTSGSSLSMGVYNGAGAPEDLWVEMYIQRVV